MSQLVLNRGNSYRIGFLSRVLRNLRLGPYFLMASLIFFVGLITIITLMYSTQQITKGNVLSQLEDEKWELVKQLEVQEMQLSQVKSLLYIENSLKVASMTEPGVKHFVNGDTAIASR